MTGHQMSLFDTLRCQPQIRPVSPDGGVVRGEVDAIYRLEHPRMAWDRACIEIHQHHDGRWMWGTSYHAGDRGGGYKVGAKWGKFADTRADALFYAASEIEDRLSGLSGPDVSLILKWLITIKDNPEAFQ